MSAVCGAVDKQLLCCGYTFDSNFDSGNLRKIELVKNELIVDVNNENAAVNVEFNLWTKPDCYQTVHENGNRTWFYFSIKGGKPSHVAKFNIMNLNKQAKLFSQGMHPVMRIGKSAKWQRIHDRPTYSIENDNFVVSFIHRGGEDVNLEFFYAFTFPYTYTELQDYLSRLDRKFRKKTFEIKVRSMEENLNLFVDNNEMTESPVEAAMSSLRERKGGEDSDTSSMNAATDLLSEIYYYRELLTTSVEHRRIDLITISSYHGIREEREERLDGLFPEKLRHRCHTFKDKKIVFISSRVHPGETPASFVLNGFMHLLLDRKSSIAAKLRKTYVFKIVPFLNPDGVYNGMYRSDTLGHNLNRVYTNPDPEKHPSIYAVRKLLRYYHHGCDKPEAISIAEPPPQNNDTSHSTDAAPTFFNVISLKELIKSHLKKSLKDEIEDFKSEDLSSGGFLNGDCHPNEPERNIDCCCSTEVVSNDHDLRIDQKCEAGVDVVVEPKLDHKLPLKTAVKTEVIKTVVEDTGKSFHLKGLSDKSNHLPVPKKNTHVKKEFKSRSNASAIKTPVLSARYRPDLTRNKTFQGISNMGNDFHQLFSQFEEATTESGGHDHTNLFLYLDLHGHASKKGVFMYGNHMAHPMQAVDCMLLPRLMSMNCHHFHFDACNFSERNMYHKGKRDGLSKEGSGRVAVYKATGLIKSYTLECNYNTGKCVNVLPPRGKDTTPKSINLVPPKYTPAIFEEVGRALGPSLLDLTNANPISRLQNSEFRTLQNLRSAMRIEIEKSFTKSQILLKAVKGKLKRMKTVQNSSSSSSGTTKRINSSELSKENQIKPFWAGQASTAQAAAGTDSQERSFLKTSNNNKLTKKTAKLPQNLYGKKENSGRKKSKVLCESGSFSGQKLVDPVHKKDTTLPIKRIKVTQTLSGLPRTDSDDSPPTSDEDRNTSCRKTLIVSSSSALDEPGCSKSKRPSGIPIFKRHLPPAHSSNFTTGASSSKGCLVPVKKPIRPAIASTQQASTKKGTGETNTNKLKKKRSLKTDANVKRKKRAVWH